MALSTFLEINLPYGLARNREGKWYAFNREYQPLGQSEHLPTVSQAEYENYFCSVKYHGLTERQLSTIAASFDRDMDGNIWRIWLYNDSCIPTKSQANMDAYLTRLGRLASFKKSRK